MNAYTLSRVLSVVSLAAGFSLPTFASTVVPTQIGATQTAASQLAPVAANAAMTDAARRQAADLDQARIWGLSVEDLQRAQVLMQPGGARAAFSAPNISPVEVLGIHARSPAERQKYAELFARALHADTERIVAWMATYSVTYARLYPNEPVMDFHGKQLPRSVIAP